MMFRALAFLALLLPLSAWGAINPVPIQCAGEDRYPGGGNDTDTLTSVDGWTQTPTAGNILLYSVAMKGQVDSITIPTGFTTLQDHQDGSDNVKLHSAWKISAGNETSFTTTITNLNNYSHTVCEFDVTDLTGLIDAEAIDLTNEATTVQSQTSGTAASSNSTGLAVAIFYTFRYNTWDGGNAFTNGYVKRFEWADFNSSVSGVFIATKALTASGSTNTVFSTTDPGDPVAGHLIIFEGDSADTTAPVYTVTPATTSVATTQIDTTATATDDLSSTVEHCGVVVADGATVPSAAQIMLGQDSTGSPATAADCNTVTSGSAAPLSFTGLSAGVPYDLHFTVEDAAANRATIESLDVTTATGNTVNYDQSAYDIGATVNATAEGMSTAITTITEQAGGDSISAEAGATTTNATFILPGSSAFLSGGSLQNTQLGASLVWRLTDGTNNADGSFSINEFGDFFFPLDCNAASCGGMSLIRDTAAESGDEVLIRILDGTGIVCSDSAVCISNDTLMRLAVRWFDVSATQWSTEATYYIEMPSVDQLTPQQIEVLGLENCGGGNYRLTCP